MIGENSGSHKAFAIWFKDLSRWDPGSFQPIAWDWPREAMKPISSVLKARKEKVDRTQFTFSDLQPITIHFDGSIEPREINGDREYTMDLFFAHPGDIVVSKIDLKNGAVAIVPNNWRNVVVTGHFAVYEPDQSKLVPEYSHRLIQTKFFKEYLWRNKVGAEGRKEVKLDFFESITIPLPSLQIQETILVQWREAQERLEKARLALQTASEDLNKCLLAHTSDRSRATINSPWLAVKWDEVSAWDVKTARAAAFRIANPSYRPLEDFVEEATELVKPWEQPDKRWPIYGVNNKNGVFFSHYQRGEDFNASYKHIRKDWFFHNPTRSSVGSLGIVPDVPDDALTSPEYQVWKIKDGLIPEFVAVLIRTPFFLNLIQFHRVGAVKQRLYVENLLQIPIPVFSAREQRQIAQARVEALKEIAEAEKYFSVSTTEIEALFQGTKVLQTL